MIEWPVEPIGYFMEDEIYFQGVKQPVRKTLIIVCMKNEDDNTAQVLSVEGNWYTLNISEVTLY